MANLAAMVLFTFSSPVAADGDVRLRHAEAFIDAFYSFEPTRLQPYLAQAPQAHAKIMYYQGWARGGEYKVVDRQPCQHEADLIICRVTVADNLIKALQINMHVTDVFSITMDKMVITKVETSSNDPEAFAIASEWLITQQPQIMQTVCKGLMNGGPTPAQCARAFVAGFKAYIQTTSE
ncbi:MAG: hypothetical protein AAF541_23115 [Pseudomonadota bacterium]